LPTGSTCWTPPAKSHLAGVEDYLLAEAVWREAIGLRQAMTAWPRRLKEAVLFLHFELVDEYSETPGHGSRKGVVLVLKAFPNR
jgi:hypothetical protein